MKKELYSWIEEWQGEPIIMKVSIGGGCISNAEKIGLLSGRTLFLKSGNGMFLCEANGLKELAKQKFIRIPRVLWAEKEFIVMENISSGTRENNFFRIFGQQFARMHRVQNEYYGFYEDNFIGSTPQVNTSSRETDWTSFFFTNRLLYQLLLAEKNGLASKKLRKGFHLLENKITEILKGSEEKPSLLHGDLWSGNYLCDKNGAPVLIDPAVYYGHREADLAMTKLFGGFTKEFYSAYNEEYPLKEGASYREKIYILYHVMNHLNMFGVGYAPQAEGLLWSYL